jgi:hypothetical protein
VGGWRPHRGPEHSDPSDSGIQLYETGEINDRGEIAVNGLDANSNNHAILLIPCDENHPDVAGWDYDLIDAETAARINQNPTERPGTLTPGTHMAGMFHRFRLSKKPASGGKLGDLCHSRNRQLAGRPSAGSRSGNPASYCEMFNGVLTGLSPFANRLLLPWIFHRMQYRAVGDFGGAPRVRSH